MDPMSRIFTRHLRKAYDLHESIRGDLDKVKKQFLSIRPYLQPKDGNLSLFEVLLVGQRLKVFDDVDALRHYRDAVLQALHAEDPMVPQLSLYGVFDFTEITALKASYRFMLDMKLKNRFNDLLRVDLTSAEVEKLSEWMTAPATLLSLKYYWLHRKFDDFDFNGILSNTTPVRTALRKLYGTDFGSSRDSSKQQYEMATQLNVNGLNRQEYGYDSLNAFNLNTCLWFMGQMYPQTLGKVQ